MAEDQAQDLRRSGASAYVPDQYISYETGLNKIKEDIGRETEKFILFRDYSPYVLKLKSILKLGNEILSKVQEEKAKKSTSIAEQISSFKKTINNIKNFTLKINEGRLARTDLIKADLLLDEVELLYKKGEYDTAEKKLTDLSSYVKSAEDALGPIISRYSDRSQVGKWRKWVDETIEESKENGAVAIIVNKSDRKLTIYKNGELVKTYSVGLGRNGSFDKLHAGDNATPEGRYRITKKLPESRYYKALLINYPSDKDRKQFIQAKKQGLVPDKTGIGGLIEIHGGGNDTMTYGCISMENKHIEEVFNIAKIGTPVTIVGAVEIKNSISSALGGM